MVSVTAGISRQHAFILCLMCERLQECVVLSLVRSGEEGLSQMQSSERGHQRKVGPITLVLRYFMKGVTSTVPGAQEEEKKEEKSKASNGKEHNIVEPKGLKTITAGVQTDPRLPQPFTDGGLIHQCRPLIRVTLSPSECFI